MLTLEIPGGKFDPPRFFSNFLQNPLEFFREKLGNSRGSNLWSFSGESMLGVNPTQSYGKNTKSPIQDFHRFRYKNLYKIDFLNNFS